MHRIGTAAALCLCVAYVLVTLPFIGRPGIQTDEALFAAGIYPPFDERFVVRIFGRDLPLMVMSYVGALKSWIWAGVFHIWPASPVSVRVPAVLFSAAGIWLTYRFVRETVSLRAALAATALIATDPLRVMYGRYDHGPVVLQQFCLVAALLGFVRYRRTGKALFLAAAGLASGLGLWEKAVFVWLLGGVTVAGVLLFRRDIAEAARKPRHVLLFAAAFVLGALPLLLYSVRQNLATFRGNTHWSTAEFVAKARLLRNTLEGDAFFGTAMREAGDGPERAPETRLERIVVAITEASGGRRVTWMGYLASASALLFPFVWRDAATRKIVLFVLLTCLAAWLQMALNRNTGLGAHHTILLWPLPTIAIAAVMASASGKVMRGAVVLAVAVSVAAGSNLAVVSAYYSHLVRYGGTSSWTDGMFPAFAHLRTMEKTVVCPIDWGFFDTIRLYEQGRSGIHAPADPTDDEGKRIALWQISNPGFVFLTHTQGEETMPGRTERYVRFAKEAGFERVDHRVFSDTNGRPTVAIFRFEKKNGS